jgi:hypothetical protein
VRPTQLVQNVLLQGIGGTLVPTIYSYFATSISSACDAWNWFSLNQDKVRETSFWSVETLSMSICDTVYNNFNLTTCNKIPAGNYWLFNGTYPTGGLISNNPSHPNIEIVTVNSQGVITNITTCYFQP